MIAVSDRIKEDSAEAAAELRRMGISLVMLTGDNERTAKAIGREAGVDRIIAGVLPDGKEAVIRELQKEDMTMVMDSRRPRVASEGGHDRDGGGRHQ